MITYKTINKYTFKKQKNVLSLNIVNGKCYHIVAVMLSELTEVWSSCHIRNIGQPSGIRCKNLGTCRIVLSLLRPIGGAGAEEFLLRFLGKYSPLPAMDAEEKRRMANTVAYVN